MLLPVLLVLLLPSSPPPRHTHRGAPHATPGLVSVLKNFGAKFVTDTCWCMLQEPVVPVSSKALVTNSAKFAHYGCVLSCRLSSCGCVGVRVCVCVSVGVFATTIDGGAVPPPFA